MYRNDREMLMWWKNKRFGMLDVVFEEIKRLIRDECNILIGELFIIVEIGWWWNEDEFVMGDGIEGLNDDVYVVIW